VGAIKENFLWECIKWNGPWDEIDKQLDMSASCRSQLSALVAYARESRGRNFSLAEEEIEMGFVNLQAGAFKEV